jgi:hypothetical protein
MIQRPSFVYPSFPACQSILRKSGYTPSRGSRLIANLSAVTTFDTRLELGPLPSTGVTRLRRYYGPIRHPTGPRLSLAGCELTVTRGHPMGLPVLLGSSPCRLPSPLPRQDQAEASSFACTLAAAFPCRTEGRLLPLPFSGPARCSLTLRPASSLNRLKRPFCTEGSDGFVTSTATSAAFRLERQSCRVGLAPTG